MRKLLYSILFVAVAMFAACDDYIDITPKGAITVDSAYTYYELVVFPNRTYWPTSFALLTDDSYAREGNIIGNENTSLDGINFTFNENANRKELAQNNLYENAYMYILRYNIIIDNIDDSYGNDDIKKLGKAEARLLRAWEHFVVLNNYAKAYDPATAKTDGGIVIMDKYDLEASPNKSTVEETYQFIMKEINEALPYLQEKPLNLGHPSLAYGYGLKSLVCLFHRDWQEAKDAAEKCLSLNNALVDYTTISKVTSNTDYRYTGGKSGNPEVLDATTASVGFTGSIAYSYGQISPELTEMFDQVNDRRYSLFFVQSDKSSYAYYYDFGSGASIWQTTATLNRFYYATVGLRTAEVMLIAAEANARLGNNSAAMQYINDLRIKRIYGYQAEVAPSSQTDMIKLIITERRKELLFGFHRFWDLKRFNTESEYAKTITRVFPVVNKEVPQKTYTLLPNSRLYIIPFPKSAREKNPNLTLNTDE